MTKEIKVGHYVPKMKEEWTALHKKITGRRVKVESGELIRESADMILEILNEGVCWTVTPAAFPLVWKTDIDSLEFEKQRLPFPNMCIEYDFDYAFVGKNPLNSTDPAISRIVMLTEVTDQLFALISAYRPQEKHTMGDVIISWSVAPVAIVFDYSLFDDMSKWMSTDGEFLNMAFNKADGSSPLLAPALPMFEEVFDKFTQDELRALVTDLADEIRIAFGLLGILSCKNAPIEKIAPPAKLNKKRVKSGKAEIPMYRTLHISDHTTRQKSGQSDGTHASPRAHWRRGHIRNQPTAKGYVRKWIKPTIVGSGPAPKPEVVLT